MARPESESEKVYGPYCERGGYRIVYYQSETVRSSYVFETEGEAQREIAKLKRKIGQAPLVSVGEGLDRYEIYMRDDKGNKPLSIAQTIVRLKRFFPDSSLNTPLSDLDEATCTGFYEQLRSIPGKKGKPVSVDYHRNVLAEARTFLKWCLVKKKWITGNPLDGVEGVGRRRHGKEQLRIDEARTWLTTALKYAEAEEEGAIAAMMTLVMGMRCSEITSRIVRDVDDKGRLLWIPTSKTDAGRRTLKVPELLRPYLLSLCEGKKPDALLFGYHDRAWPRLWVQRICEEASVTKVTAHGHRGLHGTLSVEAGITAHAVAAALGHESFAITKRSYAKAEAVDGAAQDRAMEALDLGDTQKSGGPPPFTVINGGKSAGPISAQAAAGP